MKHLLVSLFIFGFSFQVQAVTINKARFTRLLKQKIESFDSAIVRAENKKGVISPADDMWFRLEVSRSLIKIPFVGVSIIPEVEVYWKRK